MAAAALIAACGSFAPLGSSPAQAQQAAKVAVEEGPDTLIFADGRTLRGTVVSETATNVKFKGSVNGLSFETDYDKKSILKIVKGERKADGKVDTTKPEAAKPMTPATPAKAETPPAMDGAKRYYWIDLEGNFGEEISQTPLREAMEDARKNNVDTVIISLNSEWSRMKWGNSEKLSDDTASFDEMFRGEKLCEIFTDDVPKNWKDKKPRIAFWVKQAMGGAALLPMVCPEMYFAPEGRIGGLGNLSTIFGSTGDDVVREKQRSLRLAHAEGWAIAGGYDPRLIRAMARIEYVLSYRMVDGRAELFEGYPTAGNEFLLTDDGKDANADSQVARVSGEGNDVLTLKADTALALGISKKTISTPEEMLSAMGLDRVGVKVEGKSKKIMKDWSGGIESSKRRLKKLLADYGEVRVKEPGDYQARSAARGTRIKILTEMKSILIGQYGEGISQRWLQENGIPDEVSIGTRIESIKIEQLKDRK